MTVVGRSYVPGLLCIKKGKIFLPPKGPLDRHRLHQGNWCSSVRGRSASMDAVDVLVRLGASTFLSSVKTGLQPSHRG